MAVARKRKTAGASEKRGAEENGKSGKDMAQADSVITRGIWGLVYLSIGALLLISMLFYSSKQLAAGADAHVLGPYLGTSLALGMFYLFGRVTAFAFPLAVAYIGVAKLAGRPLRLKLLLFIAVLAAELCLLLAVRHMPGLRDAGLMATADAAGSNFMGLAMVSALVPLFGGRMFGPYFIISLLMAITVMLGLRIGPESVAAVVSKWLIAVWSWMKAAFGEIRAGIRNSPDIRPESAPKGNKPGDNGAVPWGGDHPKSEKQPSKKELKAAALAAEQAARESLPESGLDAAIAAAAAVVNTGSGSVYGGPIEASLPLIEDADGTPVDTNRIPDDANRTLNGSVGATAPVARELTHEEEAKKHHQDELDAFRQRKKTPIQILTIETQDVNPVDDEDTPLPLIDDGDGFDGGRDMAGAETGKFDPDGELVDEDGGDLTAEESKAPVKPYEVPPFDILEDPPPLSDMFDQEAIERNSMILEKTLMHFKVEGKVRFVSPGPVVTRYEIELAPGVKISRVTSLHDDISLALGGQKIRIQAPIPGKAAIGIEVPNEKRQNVYFKHVLTSDNFKRGKFDLPVVIGSNISGVPFVTDITKTPHMLIAGQTGSGKSVCLNSLICTLLMTKTPGELRLIMIDPKQVEFNSYENIPHLLSPVVTESKEAVKALQWGVMEMERRYTLLKKAGARKIDDFNAEFEAGGLAGVLDEEDNKRLPFIVIIIDELADLMMTAPKDVETLIARITQKARAAGIHLIVATQRPSVNVITGVIKANLPSRIAFRTVSSIDSRTILDQGGAEGLLGLGDMLFLRNGAPDIERFHGAFIPDKDVNAIVAAISGQEVSVEKIGSFNDIIKDPEEEAGSGGDDGGGDRDALFAEAARVVVSIGQGSTSLLQRRMGIGFARAGRIMDQLEHAGIVGPGAGSKPREVLVRPEDLGAFL